MSSVRNLAAAQPYIEPCELVPDRPGHPRPLPSEEPLFGALKPASTPQPANSLPTLWDDLANGRLRPLRAVTTDDRAWLVAEVIAHPTSGLNPDDASMVVSVLCGEPRKALACELGIAVSTAAGRVLRALSKLELVDRDVDLPVVLAAQSWAGRARIPSERTDPFDFQGCRCLAVGVLRPATALLTALTPGERQVAQWLIEGLTRSEIADRRETSVFTVSRQFHSIFSALRVTGRYALIRRAAELGCFQSIRIAEGAVDPSGTPKQSDYRPK